VSGDKSDTVIWLENRAVNAYIICGVGNVVARRPAVQSVGNKPLAKRVNNSLSDGQTVTLKYCQARVRHDALVSK
jgi:hypothetical protein